MSAFAVRTGLRAHELGEDQDRVVGHADLVEAPPGGVRGGSGVAVEEHVQRVDEVQVVVDGLDGVDGRHAVEELQRPSRLWICSGVVVERAV